MGFTRGDTTVGGTGESFQDAIDRIDTKLDTIETGATADQTGAEIKLAYEAESDTNAFTDAEKTKLAGLGGDTAPSNLVYVKQASDLAGTLDSTKAYIIDGIIDMGTQSIEVPSGGLTLLGYTFDTSQLTSTENNYTMFTSPVGGSGNLLLMDVAFTTSGTSSQVFDLNDATGFNAVEMARVNFNSCTSLGTLDGFRQGLESGTGRFGGKPSMTLAGAWLGGYFIETSIIRNVDNAMTDAIYKAGTGFTMQSRFRSNQNIDLGTTAPFIDFAPSNFPNYNTVQLEGMRITRNGVVDSTDTTILPNIANQDLASRFHDNVGIENTFIGGDQMVTSETTTTINTINTFETLAGTWTTDNLTHFDSPSNGQLRFLGDNAHDFRVVCDMVIEGTAGNEITLRLRKFDSSASTFETIFEIGREVNNLQGGRDIAVFYCFKHVRLDENDYIFYEVANATSTDNVTVENGGSTLVEER